MKIIFRIAQAELRNLIFSPIAWLLVIVFFVVCGMQFVNPLATYSRVQELLTESVPNWGGFTNSTDGLSYEVFSQTYVGMIMNLYLFIPLLTMGIINREVQSGSMKLLYSSPVRTRDIVLGKYMGLVIFNLILTLCVALFLTTGYFSITHADYKWFLSALLAIFLLANTYAAIGLFISSITSYQIVAGILTFVVFFALQAVRGLWQDYDFVRDLTYFMSISGRVESMIRGLITTRDVIYFILIIILFLSFALIKLKSTQESRSWRVSLFRYAGAFVVVLALGYLSSRPGYVGYLDVTARKLNTIDPATQKVIRELDGSPLKVTLYTNMIGKNAQSGMPAGRNTYLWGFWEKVIRFYPNIDLEYVYYYDVKDGDSTIIKQLNVKNLDEAAAKYADMLGLRLSIFSKPAEIRKKIDLSEEDYGLVMQLEYKGKKSFLRTYDDPKVWPDENHISGAIRRLTRMVIPKILFTTGHYERTPFKTGEREFADHTTRKGSRDALINKGVDVDTINLQTNDIPAGTDLLVVADPRSALSGMEQAKILAWLDNGGNTIIYAEPGKQQMLQPILNKIGVHLDDGIIVSENAQEMPHFVEGNLTHIAHFLALESVMFNYQKTGKMPGGMLNVGAVNLTYDPQNGFTTEPIIAIGGSEKTWIEKGTYVADSAAPVFSGPEGDVKKDVYVTGLKMSRQIDHKEQRIIVTGDADFMSNLRGGGGTLRAGGYSWALYNEYPVYHNMEIPKDIYMKIGRRTGEVLWLSYIYIIPGIILLTGIIVLIRRKRK